MKSYIKKIQILLLLFFIFNSSICPFAQNTEIDSIYIENFYIDSMPLKSYVGSYFSMTYLNHFDTITSPCKNKEAIFLYENRIEKLKSSIHEENPFSFLYYENFFFMTGLGKDSIDNFNRPIIFQSDINDWEKWLIDNKDRICWFKEKNFIYIRKE
jgi:hypothetical protein